MKIIRIFMLMVLSLVGYTACTNELTYVPENKVDSINLVKSPDMLAWSGQELLGTTFNTRSYSYTMTRSGEPSLTKWQWDTNIEGWPAETDRQQAVSQSEFNYVMEYLANHPNEGYTECELSTYFLQLVGKSHVSYHEPFMDDNGNVHHYADIDGSGQMDYFELNGVHINDYNGDAGPWIYVENLPLNNPRYHDSYANLVQENHYRFYYIPNENGDGYSLYLCFDYATSKYDNGQLDFDGDGVYNDWVIKIIPGDGSAIIPPSTGNDNPDIVVPDNNRHNNEVEVNLEVVDSHSNLSSGIPDLASKLSIHVRKATDVEIIIPLPSKYVCESDDLYIFQKHEELLGTYGGSLDNPMENKSYSLDYNVGGNIVTLHVDFIADGEGYIKVWTEGINQAVIDYCWDNFKDGINFEVWTYYQTEKHVWGEEAEDKEFGDVVGTGLTRETLLSYLNQSTIEFLDENPDYYINAFGWDYVDGTNGEEHLESINPDDCYVRPISREYASPIRTSHLNSTPYNDIYVLSGVIADDIHQ